MALNLSIQSPLTLYSGSVTAHYIPGGTSAGEVLHMPTGSLPVFGTDGWDYIIKTNPFSTTLATAQNVNDLTITFTNNRRYLVIGYLSGASSATAQGFRVGVSAANLTTNIYSIEVPTSTTGIPTIGNNALANAGAAPAANTANYYFVKMTAVVTTAPTGVPVWRPTIQTETAGNTAVIGPSVLYYKEY